MTDKDDDFEKFGHKVEILMKRIFQPETAADKELMWTAIGFFVFGAIVF